MAPDRNLSEKRRFAEDFGITVETMGMPRMAGRIWGWLLVCDPPHQSAAQLAETLSASKGSISTMTRLLMQFGILEKISLPGERSAFYRVREGGITELLKLRMRQTTVLREMSERGLEIVKDEPRHVRRHLEEMRDLYLLFEREFPRLVEQWERERKGTRQ